ncbi:hypothetical protein ACJRO7_014403 [Eucalyptus globulus]|uniref:TIR domain-containing protein n=1 Tax=Eucalyptus globulus TaxID=34317 RepID=A0ABD3L0Y5_EUCGL
MVKLNGTKSIMSSIDDNEVRKKRQKGNKCEVFLSFRGQDTRKGFTDYLYTILVDAGIHVFKDDNELYEGEQIGPELHNSITQSKISIPIISEGYTSSKWCLRELALMMNCKRSKGQKLFPIFYKVEPSSLRHLKGIYGDAIYQWKKNLGEKVVEEWEEAIQEVSSLRGWESWRIENGYEGALVKIVVKKVWSELNRISQLIVPKELMGIDERVEQIMSWIDAKFNDTRIVGIWGNDGIGKTTLAKALYNKLSCHFKHLSFVKNIRETSLHKGIDFLQKQLIDDILKRSNDVSIDKISVIKSQFMDKKVLILLDDIDASTDLNALAGDVSWFKAGSIVIITTKNKSILDEANVDYKYPLNKLSSNESLILFSRHAFQKDYPKTDYENISRDVISYIGRLPLALKVIGSFLCEKSRGVWNDILKKLREVPHQKVREMLRICYEELDDMEKKIFLDIACFLIGSSKQSPTYMWNADGFFQKNGVEVLSRMSLIEIDNDGKLMMHDQLRDLGQEIVHLENLKEPQKRSRLWIYEEALDVLDNNKGTQMIEALCLDECGYERSYTGEQFKELINLRFLKVCGANFTGDFQNLLPQLRWLQWEHCPSNFVAANFHPKELVVLNLSWSEISEDWGGWIPLKTSTQLKVLNLTGCLSLRSTPDLSAFESLEILILEECKNLEMIHHSFRDIKTLISLNVKSCERLEELLVGVGGMEQLRELLINDTAIREIPISEGDLMKLETLCASWCPQLAQFPEFTDSLVSLTQLDLSHSEIEKLPKSIGSLVSLTHLDLSYSRIEELPQSMGSLVSLTQLDLSHSGFEKFPESMSSLVSLSQLDLSNSGIEELPESIGSLKKLETLNASHCALLAHIHNSIGNLTSLALLDLRKCHKLAQLPDSIQSLLSLQRLLLRGCHSLRKIPDSIGKLVSLTELDLKSTAIAELPQSIQELQNLRILDIRGTHIKERPGAILTARIFKL